MVYYTQPFSPLGLMIVGADVQGTKGQHQALIRHGTTVFNEAWKCRIEPTACTC